MDAKADKVDSEAAQAPDVPHEAHVPQTPRDQAQGVPASDRHDLDQLHELHELHEQHEEDEYEDDDDFVEEEEEETNDDDNATSMMGTEDSTENGSLAMHLVTVEEMVHDIKRMLLDSTSEISKIQEADHLMLRKQAAGIEANQKNVGELAAKLQTLQSDVQTLVSQVQTVVETQAVLTSRLDRLEKERTANNDDAAATTATANSTQDGARGDQSEKSKAAHQPKRKKSKQSSDGEGGGMAVESEITAAACKSLSLSQALGEKVQELDVSVSSEDDEERAESRASDWDIERELTEKGTLKINRGYPQYNRDTDEGRRRQTVQELVESEQDYCRQLWGLLDGCLAPLQESRLLGTRELRLMFPPYLSRLYRQHCQMLATLQERLLNWNWSGVVGDIFARMTDPHTDNLMALYRDYLNDFQAAVACYKQQFTTSRSFRAFIKNQREQGQGDMMSLLLAPLQRMPKYSLQLQQLLKYTPTEHPDHYYLQSSLAHLRTFVNQLNDEMAHTMQFVNVEEENMRFGGKGQSFRSSASGSSCENSHLPSARDSGIHSNGEDFHGSRGLLHSASDKALSPDHMDRYGIRNGRRGVMSARSQPDLSHNGLYGGSYLVDGMHTVAHLPPQDRSNRYRRQRQRRREQVIDRLGRHGSPSPAYGAHLLPGYSSSPRLRPASAVDFLGSPEQNFQGNRDRLFARPQTSLGAPSYDGRSRIPSGHLSHPHPHHRQHGNKFLFTSNPVSSGSSFSNSPRETGAPVLIDGKVVYVEGLYDRLQPAGSSYVLHDEDETRGPLLVGNLQELALHGEYMGDPHEGETDNSGELSQEEEEEELASSLAHSLRQEAALDEDDGDLGNVSQGFEQGLGSPSIFSEGQGQSPLQEHESDSNRPIFDRNELRLNLESLADTDRDPIPNSGYGSSSLSNPSTSPEGPEEPPNKACELAVKPTKAANLLSVTKMPPPAPKRVVPAEDAQGYQISVAAAAPAAMGPVKAAPVQDTRSSGGSHQEDEASGKKDKKKKRDSRSYSSSENLNRSSEDLSGTKKKPSIRTSLKNFFGKKKHETEAL